MRENNLTERIKFKTTPGHFNKNTQNRFPNFDVGITVGHIATTYTKNEEKPVQFDHFLGNPDILLGQQLPKPITTHSFKN